MMRDGEREYLKEAECAMYEGTIANSKPVQGDGDRGLVASKSKPPAMLAGDPQRLQRCPESAAALERDHEIRNQMTTSGAGIRILSPP